jgi:hypothetical protein
MTTGGTQGKSIPAKPTVEELGIDVGALRWQRSDSGTGSIEIAFAGVKPEDGTPPSTAQEDRGEWILMRVAGDPARRVLVYDRFEWECFLDGAKNGEFDDAQ